MSESTIINQIELEDRHILLDRKAVLNILGLKADSALYRAIKEDSFPKPLRIGGRASRWRKSDVLEWIDNRPQHLEHEAH